jgi:subtilisin family serine protease
MPRFPSILLLLLAVLAPGLVMADPRGERVRSILHVVETLCPLQGLTGLGAQTALEGSWLLEERHRPDSGPPRLTTLRLILPGNDEITIERRAQNGQLRQFRVSLALATENGPQPYLLAIADGACRVQSGRALRAEGPVWRFLDQLEGDLTTLRWTETLQAPWPEGNDGGGVRIGLIDSGLAYDLEIFRGRLARGPGAQPLGYDFWDLDPWPYDGDVARGPFLPIRHGTAVASVLVREAPKAALIPYRYPRPDMSRLGKIVERAAEADVRVLAIPLGSRKREDWRSFETALAQHDILAIVSAGNDGVNIDETPIYPASLRSDRILTVTSADDFGRLAPGSNWGAQSVDVMVPGESLDVVDFQGGTGVASGSSYAVPRLAALAARILEVEPGLTAVELKARILARAAPSPFERDGVLAVGWIPDPLAP